MSADHPARLAARRLAPSPFVILTICFFLSGATGLVYQVVWLRMLGLVFGHTVYATTTVLVAFMAGLGLGSWILARRARRLTNLIGAYGWLEVGIGVYCAILPLLFTGAASVYLGLHRSLGLSYDTFSLVQFVLIAAILVVPTTLMGGTLPVLSQALARNEVGLGRTIGTLYAVNTFGAVAGVAFAGYVLLPAVGNRLTLALAAVSNLAVGGLAIAYSRHRRVEGDADHAPAPEGPEETPAARRRMEAWLTTGALGVSGAIAMVYEVTWTRALGLIVGSSTYAFTAMLLAFLIGIAGGSAVYSWLWGTRRATPRTFAVLQVGIGLTTMLVMLLYERLPVLFLLGVNWSDSPAAVQLLQIGLCVVTLLPVTGFIGATFPCAVAVVSRTADRAAEDVGHTYAINTLGAIAGCLVGGLVMIPLFGMQFALRAAVSTNFVLGAALYLLPVRTLGVRRTVSAFLSLAVASAAWFLPHWSHDVLSAGVAVYAKEYLRKGWTTHLSRPNRNDLLFYRDGPTGTVTVHKVEENLFLRVNGKTDASTSGDMPTQLLLGHLPLLFHPAPREVLLIGLGSGITAGAVAAHPIDHLDVVELEPAVVQAARLFAAHNGGVLDDPRVKVSVADGRNFLLTTPRRYDVIVSEPSNPWIGGLASLFTVEMFQHARSQLRPGGIMVQWIQGYGLDPGDLKMVIRTFGTVFPSMSLWNTNRGDYLLLGTLEVQNLDLRILDGRLKASPAVTRSLERMGVRGWADILGYFILDREDATRLAREAGLNTDDLLPLEFSAPKALYRTTADVNWNLVVSARRSDLPPLGPESQALLASPDARHALGVAFARRSHFRPALKQFEAALDVDPRHRPSLEAASAAILLLGGTVRSRELAERAVELDARSVNALYLAGVTSARLYDTARARIFLERAAVVAPDDPRIRRALLNANLGELRGGLRPEDDLAGVSAVFAR